MATIRIQNIYFNELLNIVTKRMAFRYVVKLQPRVKNRQKGVKVIKLQPLRDVFFYVLEFTRLWSFP